MVVTLNAGRLTVIDEPLAAIVPTLTGATGPFAATCVCADVAVIR